MRRLRRRKSRKRRRMQGRCGNIRGLLFSGTYCLGSRRQTIGSSGIFSVPQLFGASCLSLVGRTGGIAPIQTMGRSRLPSSTRTQSLSLFSRIVPQTSTHFGRTSTVTIWGDGFVRFRRSVNSRYLCRMSSALGVVLSSAFEHRSSTSP